MVDEEGFKELPPSEFLQVAEATWLVLNVSSHSGAAVQAAGVTKIARSVIAPLAEHHVSVLMLSTYQTDFILVREQDLSVVIHTLAQEFDIYREVGGEPVPVTRDDFSNGFPRTQHAGPSPTVHPIQSPQNRFCVLTLDPETLPAIATTLIDVLFYSHSTPKEAASSSPEPSSITFFAFSLIEGYISIVMDAETQKKFPSDLLLTSSSGELWRMVRIGGQPLGFGEGRSRCWGVGEYLGSNRHVPHVALLHHPQMNVASWHRSQVPLLPLTSLPTTSAPSTSTMPWCPRTVSAASSRSSSGGRKAWLPEAHGEQSSLPALPSTQASKDFSKLFP
nr:cytosolic arginine sensor for mTORC1 subunit 1 isoform X6 [Pongo pygmaeus]